MNATEQARPGERYNNLKNKKGWDKSTEHRISGERPEWTPKSWDEPR